MVLRSLLGVVAVLLFGCAGQRDAVREPVAIKAPGWPHVPPDYLSSGKDRLILSLSHPDVKAACLLARDVRAMTGELAVQAKIRNSVFGNVRVMSNTMMPRVNASDENTQAFQMCAHRLAVALFTGWQVPTRMDVLRGQALVRFQFSTEGVVLVVSASDLTLERYCGPSHLRSHEWISASEFTISYHEPRERLLDFIDSLHEER